MNASKEKAWRTLILFCVVIFFACVACAMVVVAPIIGPGGRKPKALTEMEVRTEKLKRLSKYEVMRISAATAEANRELLLEIQKELSEMRGESHERP